MDSFNLGMAASFCSLFSLILVLLGWRIVNGLEHMRHLDRMNDYSEKDVYRSKDGRISIPDMSFVLNNLLRYENSARHPTEADAIFTLSSRSKGGAAAAGDPLAVLATGFQGARGKRVPPSDNEDEIPVFANGFPANRGR